jgi:hypothetical protein
MKRPPFALKTVLAVTAGVTMIYLLSILSGLPPGWIFGLCLSAIVALVWMTLRILKDPYSTNQTFDEYFYQDRPDLRRKGKE